MSDDIRRLLQVHAFLNQALAEHGNSLPADAVADIGRRRDRAFLDLLTFETDDVRIMTRQLTCAIDALAAHSPDGSAAIQLREICLDIVGRLVPPKTIPGSAVSPSAAALIDVHKDGSINLSEGQRSLLDSLSDRASVVSLDYRYIFTNSANASYRQRKACDFPRRPIWTVVGDKRFETFTKPLIDQCAVTGSSLGSTLDHFPDGNRSFSMAFDPLRGDRGRIVAVLITSRETTALLSA